MTKEALFYWNQAHDVAATTEDEMTTVSRNQADFILQWDGCGHSSFGGSVLEDSPSDVKSSL